MAKTGIVLVHGMGNHPKGWSERLQLILKSGLYDLGIEPIFYEATYSKIIENERVGVAPDRVIRGLSTNETKVLRDLNTIEQEIMEQIGDKDHITTRGIRKDWEKLGKVIHELLTYVIPYLGNINGLKKAVNAEVYKEIERAANETHDGHLVLVGHSLGSVVSWNLVTEPQIDVKLNKLITLGSPLPILYVVRESLDRLFRIGDLKNPQKVPCDWTNVRAPGDIVSLFEIKDPPFRCATKPKNIEVCKVDPHESLVNNTDVIINWLPQISFQQNIG